MSTTERTTLAELKSSERFQRPAVRKAFEDARLRFELAETVRTRREHLGLTQKELGRLAGMTQSSVARFEAGGAEPTLPTLEKLAVALGLHLTVKMEPDPAAGADQQPMPCPA
ncbi:helix-turn-helix domain-containing protein [Kitasatospora azatica]|uniref:helix-turn-helix domain-containing protein n=1 Tax=Kitasatospora azatica TaxID=58347 RepID=UPI00055BEF9B|nr:helix-turn-helix transcriptional regulator [Kitasatospora azatica]